MTFAHKKARFTAETQRTQRRNNQKLHESPPTNQVHSYSYPFVPFVAKNLPPRPLRLCGESLFLLITVTLTIFSAAAQPLVTGKSIPATNPTQNIGSLPMNLTLSADGQYIVTTGMGYYEYLYSIRTSDGKAVSHIEFSNHTNGVATPTGGEDTTAADPAKRTNASNGLYYGLAISPTNTVYAAQGAHDSIAILQLDNAGQLTSAGSIETQRKDFPAGLALDDRNLLYVSNNASGTGDPRKLTGSVAIYDTAKKSELGRYTFSASHGGTSNFPLGLAALKDGSKTYVAAERDDAVYVLDTHDPAHPTLATTLNTGAHPVTVLLSRDQSQLFVANSLSDTISIVDTKTDKITATILLRPKMARDLPGVTPVALALDPHNDDRLFVALGDMNAIAVLDIDDTELRGYIPTGWYPSSLAVTPDGKRLLVTNAKGTSVRNPNNVPDPHDPKKHKTTLTALEGNVISVDIPNKTDLAATTDEVLKENRLDTLDKPQPNPLASIGLSSGKIKHVIYIIKENRTYDQILGDLPQGNSDPSLVLFGRDVTPNQHALAERFVLLDNLYACGEVSGDGWDWSTQGMADAYVIRNIPYNYSHRGRKYDEEGQNNGYPTAGAKAKDDDGKPLWKDPAYKTDAAPIPDVANTNRNIWDAAHEAKISSRNYGFFLTNNEGLVGSPGGPDNTPASIGLLPGGHDLAGVTDLDFRRFDLDYPDSDAPDLYFKQSADKDCLFAKTTYGQSKSPSRFSEWNREFQLMLSKDPTGGAVPTFTMIRMGTDHTVAAKAGKHAPQSYVADNDYAVGQVVEAVSKSSIWKDTAIFIIEDDAQSGIDHIDAHRTTGFVISPWIKAHSIDHHFYNTDSMLKTIELLLNLKPLSQYDAVADPILDWDTTPSNVEAYAPILPPKELIAKINPIISSLPPNDPRRQLAEDSETMDFTHADAAPARELDEITWKSVKGTDLPVPKMRGVPAGKEDDDD
jgi:YVTN family beta-propeller protein